MSNDKPPNFEDPDLPEWDELPCLLVRWKVHMELQRIRRQQAPIDPVEAVNILRRSVNLILSNKLS